MVRVTWETPAIMVITLDRPERRNAVNVATMIELGDALHEASVAAGGDAAGGPGAARVVVLTGAPPAFCAGADLDGVDGHEFRARLSRVLQAFTELPLTVVGAIDGPALGAGTQLAAVCDLRVATPGSRFGVPAARLGIAVDAWTVGRITQEFSAPVARAMLLGAETFNAERLYAAGAVHRLGSLDDALAWAAELATLAPLSIAAHKLALERAGLPAGADADPADPAVEQARATAWSSSDAEEGRRAFLAKRPPQFTGH